MRLVRLVILVVLACGSLSCADDTPDKANPGTAVESPALSDADRARAEFESVAAASGSIEGLIVFEGTPPARTPINTAAEGGCGLDPDEPALTEVWVVDRGRMANVFVWIENPPTEQPAVPVSNEALLLRQRGCVYRPHASALRVGQMLRVSNEDRARHNVRTLPRRDENPSINQTQAEGAPLLELVFNAPEVAVPILCDLHPWMTAWVGVFEHRFFAVTGADGRFGWSGLPPGEYEVRAWHEALGRLSARAVVGQESGSRVCITFRKKP